MEEPETYIFHTTPGTRWIYEWVEIDSNGVETDLGLSDTVRVMGDTLLNGEEFAIYWVQTLGGSFEEMYRRDSSGYIINQYGQVLLSYENFSDTLSTGSYPGYLDFFGRMQDDGEVKAVPAGDFSSIRHEQIFYDPSGDPVTSCGDLTIEFNTWYNPEIGEISQQAALLLQMEQACSIHERRLVEFHIE